MPTLTNEAIRFQVLLERVKAGENLHIDAFLREMDQLLRDKLASAHISSGQRERVEKLLSEIRAALVALQDRSSAAFLARLEELADTSADIETRALSAALAGYDTIKPIAEVIRAAVTTAPLSVRGAGGGLLLSKFIEKHDEATLDRVEGVIRRGFAEGRTTDQITRDLRGTKAANYADGVIGEARRYARGVAHTAVQHVAHEARRQSWEANADIIKGVRWISTLDSHTSALCQSLDQKEFPLDKGPRPPAHFNCRSTVVPITKSFRELGLDIEEIEPGTRASVGGQVSAKLSYFEWLKHQPADFVEAALGKTRAAVFLRGGISPDEFARLQLGKNFEPLTIAEMRDRAPLVFKRAGL